MVGLERRDLPLFVLQFRSDYLTLKRFCCCCCFLLVCCCCFVVVVVGCCCCFLFLLLLFWGGLGAGGGGYFYCLTSVCISVCFGCVSLLRVLQPLTLSYNSYRTATSGCQREGMCRRYDRKDYWHKIYI